MTGNKTKCKEVWLSVCVRGFNAVSVKLNTITERPLTESVDYLPLIRKQRWRPYLTLRVLLVFDFGYKKTCFLISENVTCARHGADPLPSLWWECSSILGQVMENGE